MPKHFQNNSKKLRKSPENDFFYHQNGQITGVKLTKSVDFREHFRSTSSNIALLVLKKKIIKSFPLIAKDIKKKKNGVNSFFDT